MLYIYLEPIHDPSFASSEFRPCFEELTLPSKIEVEFGFQVVEQCWDILKRLKKTGLAV